MTPTTYNKPTLGGILPFAVASQQPLGVACDGMDEIWKPVYGYDGLYEVSSTGDVRSVDRIATHQMGGPLKLRGKKLSVHVNPKGYCTYALCRHGKLKTFAAHTLVLEAFVGPRPEGQEACHLDGNRQNPRLDNLRWDTRVENQRDRLVHGTDIRGEKHPKCKLTEEQVQSIRNDSRPIRVIGPEYGIHPATVTIIKKRRNWKWLP